MKVILQKDVANVGRKFDVVDVPNGYALNKLIPTGIAVAATGTALKSIESHQAKAAQEAQERDTQFAATVDTLSAAPLQITMEANENGQLFQAVHAEQIAAAAKEAGADLAIDSIVLGEVIKSVGTHEVQLALGDNKATITIEVQAA